MARLWAMLGESPLPQLGENLLHDSVDFHWSTGTGSWAAGDRLIGETLLGEEAGKRLADGVEVEPLTGGHRLSARSHGKAA